MCIHFKKYTWLGIISSCTQIKFTGRYFFKRNLKKWPSKWELLSSTFIPMVLFITVCVKCSNFYTCGRNPKVWPSKWELLSSTFLWYCWKPVQFPSLYMEPWLWWDLLKKATEQYSVSHGIFSPVTKWVLAHAVQLLGLMLKMKSTEQHVFIVLYKADLRL